MNNESGRRSAEQISSQRQVAIHIAATVNETESSALHAWAIQLLEIKSSSVSSIMKAQQALILTQKSHVIWPVLKLVGGEMKRRAWDQRNTASRFGLGGAAVGAVFFAGHSAGIAALGTAVGVPLWVVFGSGAAFAGVLVDELRSKKASDLEKRPNSLSQSGFE